MNAQGPQGRRPQAGGDRDRGGRGPKGRPGGRGRRGDGEPSPGGHRVVVELSSLEKALGKADLLGQLQPLDEVVRHLRSLRLRALADLEPNARGRLITTLLRVSRQPRPAAEEGAPASEAPPAEESATGAARGEESPPAETSAEPASGGEPAPEPAAGGEVEAEPGAEAAADGEPTPQVAAASAAEAPAEASTESVSAEAAPKTPPSPAALHADVLYRVGLAWLAVREAERAESAFAAAGRRPSPEEVARADAAPAAAEGQPPSAPRRPVGERAPGRGATSGRAPRERAPRPPVVAAGDWQAQAEVLASRGRTRDAARLHERHGSPAEALRLYQAGGDAKGALRAALAARDMEAARRLAQTLPAGEARAQLERAEAWELLMELLVKSQAFDEVAKLYERARQFDQAALAWERAGKLGLGRKAFERAHDAAGADRLRTLEVQRLVERGDRLGAAQLLVQGGRRAEATELLSTLPATKAYRFLEQLKLAAEARALGEAELAKATEQGPGPRARWLELLGRRAEAAQAWEEAGRKDRAYPLLEALGEFARGAAFAESAGHRDQAIRLYRRAGDDAAADRLEATPPSTPPPAPAEDAQAEDPRVGTPEAETGSSGTPTV